MASSNNLLKMRNPQKKKPNKRPKTRMIAMTRSKKVNNRQARKHVIKMRKPRKKRPNQRLKTRMIAMARSMKVNNRWKTQRTQSKPMLLRGPTPRMWSKPVP